MLMSLFKSVGNLRFDTKHWLQVFQAFLYGAFTFSFFNFISYDTSLSHVGPHNSVCCVCWEQSHAFLEEQKVRVNISGSFT